MPFLLAFIAGSSAAAWIYMKMRAKTASGANAVNAMIVAGVGGVFVLVLVWILVGKFL
jgi:hypothetical protein